MVENPAPNLPAPKNRCFRLPLVPFCSALRSVAAGFPGQFRGEGAGEIRGIWMAFHICLDSFKAVY